MMCGVTEVPTRSFLLMENTVLRGWLAVLQETGNTVEETSIESMSVQFLRTEECPGEKKKT